MAGSVRDGAAIECAGDDDFAVGELEIFLRYGQGEAVRGGHALRRPEAGMVRVEAAIENADLDAGSSLFTSADGFPGGGDLMVFELGQEQGLEAANGLDAANAREAG